jgi:hypothetical protein
MINSLGMGMQALSKVIRRITPGQPMAVYTLVMKSMILCSIEI